MRDFKGMKRQRGRNRKPGGGGGNANAANPNRSWDSQGPENIKVRGNAQTVYERYLQLARDAGSSGDRVLAENYLQHAEHYFRVLRALQPQRPVSEIAARELSNQGYDIDFEDETGAQAAAFLAAQQAAERAAQPQADNRDGEGQRDYQNRENAQSRDGQSRDGQPREQREWTPRPPRENRDNAEGGQPRAEGEQGEGGRRETRRERWERRREERNRRFENGEAPLAEDDEPAPTADADEPAKAETPRETIPEDRPQRERRPRRDAVEDDAPTALPGFLTRSSAPAATPVAADGPPEGGEAEAPAPKRRAPRKKAEPAVDEG